jgi:hypothetical protein
MGFISLESGKYDLIENINYVAYLVGYVSIY